MSQNIKALLEQFRANPNKRRFCKACDTDCTSLLIVKNKYGFGIYYPICTQSDSCSNQTREILMCKKPPERY